MEPPKELRFGRPPTPPSPPVRSERMTGVSLALLLAAPLIFVTLALSTSGPSPAATALPSTFTAAGKVALVDGDRLPAGAPCVAPPGYSDIRAGASVVIYDRSGARVVATVLDAGTADGAGRCVFTWEATGVPTSGGPYVADIAGHGTVPVTYNPQ